MPIRMMFAIGLLAIFTSAVNAEAPRYDVIIMADAGCADCKILNEQGQMLGHRNTAANETEIVRWSASTGKTSLGLVPADYSFWTINGEGYALFYKLSDDVEPVNQWYIWHAATGLQQLEYTLDGIYWSVEDSLNVMGSNADQTGFEVVDGVTTQLLGPYTSNLWPMKRNDNGMIIGLNHDGTQYEGVVWNPGETLAQLLPSLNGGNNMVHDVNNANQIVGQSDSSVGWGHAVLWENGLLQDLGAFTPFCSAGIPDCAGHERSEAFGINEQGTIVGSSFRYYIYANQRLDHITHAVMWKDGEMIDLDSTSIMPPGVGGYIEQATQINDQGDIVAKHSDQGTVLLRPQTGSCGATPFFLLSLGSLGGMLRRRRQ